MGLHWAGVQWVRTSSVGFQTATTQYTASKQQESLQFCRAAASELPSGLSACSMAAELRWQQLLALLTSNVLQLEVPVGQSSRMQYVLQPFFQNTGLGEHGAEHFERTACS